MEAGELKTKLQYSLSQPLPGRKAHRRMAPALSYGRHFGPAPSNAKPAAVMVLLYPHDDQWFLPLTLRPMHLPDHAGQVCLPGGRVALSETNRDAAFRELHEELGVELSGIWSGQLSPLYVYASHHFVHPVVAIVSARPNFIPLASEVAGFIEWPISALNADENIVDITIHRHNTHWTSPAWKWQNTEVWGATAMILAELAAVLSSLENQPTY